MKGYRFYLEYPNKTEKDKATVKEPGNHCGNVIATLLREDGHFQHNYRAIECIAGLFCHPDSAVCGSSVGFEYLQDRCKRIPERLARKIHPNLFEYLED